MSVIEHRTVDGVLGAFENSGMTKCAIWQGTEPVMVYDGDDQKEAFDMLENWLNFIEQGGTAAIYKLRIYPHDAKNITNKTAYRAVTRFQLSESPTSRYEQTPDGRVMVIRDNNRPAVGNSSGNNAQLQMLLDQNKQMMEMFSKALQQQQETKIDKLIGVLTESRTPPPDTAIDKLMKLGELIVEKPDIIDRIGYIIRPSAYTREPVPEPYAEPIAGTAQQQEPEPDQQQAPSKNDTNMSTEQQEPGSELTEAEEQAFTDRQNIALDKLEDAIGLEALTEALEKLAQKDPKKLESLLTWL